MDFVSVAGGRLIGRDVEWTKRELLDRLSEAPGGTFAFVMERDELSMWFRVPQSREIECVRVTTDENDRSAPHWDGDEHKPTIARSLIIKRDGRTLWSGWLRNGYWEAAE